MSLLKALAVLIGALALEATIGRVWPEFHRYIDLMLLPVIWYGLNGSTRSAMLVGCAGGLLQDAWFQVGVFGISGFKMTLLGWVLGGVGSRFELNNQVGRLLAGVLFALADSLLDLGLRRLFDLHSTLSGSDMAVRAAVAGLLAVWGFGLVDRLRDSRRIRRWV